MSLLKETTLLLEKYSTRATKFFGQNFLIDSNILNKIVNLTNLENKDVLEIGPGLGFLTRILLEKSKSLTAYEIDEKMIKILKNEINNPKFKLIEGDFLKTFIPDEKKYTLVANIPYNITSEILFKIFDNINNFEKIYLMVQKEVAQRICAKPSDTEYSKLTVSTLFFTNPKLEFLVDKKCFFPSPKVDSAIISLEIKDNLKLELSKPFLNFVKNCFAQRRKTILNNLIQFINKEKAIFILNKHNISQQIRPQDISYEEYLKIFLDSVI